MYSSVTKIKNKNTWHILLINKYIKRVFEVKSYVQNRNLTAESIFNQRVGLNGWKNGTLSTVSIETYKYDKLLLIE